MLMYPLHAGLKKLWSSSRMARNRRKTKRKKKVVVIMIYDPQFSSGCPFDWGLLARGAMGVLILAMTQLDTIRLGL